MALSIFIYINQTIEGIMKVTVLIDNKKKDEASPLKAEWGLSLLIEFEGHEYLLDSGQSENFALNASALGKSISDIEYGILSHNHYDHANGIETFFLQNKNAKFYLREGTKENTYHKHWIFYEYIGMHKGWLKKYADRFVFASKDFCVAPNVYLIPHKTPGLEAKGKAAHLSMKLNHKYSYDNFYYEQSLVFDTEEGLVIFNSCSHGGADNIVREVGETFKGKKIKAVIGGFHLFCLDDREVKSFAQRLDNLEVEKIVTGHCTGDHAFEILKSVLGDKVKQMYTGLEMEI